MNFEIHYFKYRKEIKSFEIVVARKIIEIVEININNQTIVDKKKE